MYIWELKHWPHLTWDRGRLAASLAQVSREQGRLLGRMQSLGFDLRREAQLSTLTEDVVRSSEIEGEKLDTDQVRSSIARRLGMDIGGLRSVDRDVEGVVEMMLDATTHYAQPLTADRLFDWHAALFPTGRSGMQKIGSSPNSGERSPDLEEEVLVIPEAVGHPLDDLDLVVDALEHAGVQRIAAVRQEPGQVAA